VTLDRRALARWKYQRYMQDYLATIQSVDDNVGRCSTFSTQRAREEHDRHLHERPGLLSSAITACSTSASCTRNRCACRSWCGGQRDQGRHRSDAMALNVDFAPTFLDAAGVAVPPECREELPARAEGRTPADWRTSMYYRYYHDPGDHNTRAHYGVRTQTHKLIYFWKKDQWELFDLVHDPQELHNLYGQPGQEQLTATLKAELLA
jgi:arylsulfatase A-like enzyme